MLDWGNACLEQADYEPARNYLMRSQILFSELDYSKGVADAHFYLAYVELKSGAYEAAEQTIQEAYRYYQQEEDVRGIGRSMQCLAGVALSRGQVERAAAFYHVYADLLRLQGVYGEAERYAFKALTMFREMGDRNSEVNGLNLLAGIEIRWNDAEPERGRYAQGLGY